MYNNAELLAAEAFVYTAAVRSTHAINGGNIMKKRMMAMLMTAILVIASVPFTAFADEMPAEVLGGEVVEAVAAEAAEAEAEAIPAAAGEEAEAAAEVTKTTLAGVDSTDWYKLQNAIDEASPAPISGVFDVSKEEGTGIKILKLLKNITAESDDTYLNVPNDSKLILDLNGKTLDRGLKGKTSVTGGNVIRAGEGVSLTIKNGTITGSYPINNSGKGALRCQKTTKLNLNNVRFVDCTNVALFLNGVNSTNIEGCLFSGNTYGGNNIGGAAIDVGNIDKQRITQRITIENCSFENNVITGGSGSAIHLYVETGDINTTIKDSTFTGNRAESDIGKEDDGGVICAYTGSLILDGCTITGNTAAAESTNNHCGGVSVSKNVTSFIIKGKTVIKDNTCGGEPADLCLQNNGAKFKVEDLNPEAKIGVKALYGFTGTSVIAEGLKAGDIKCFFPDDPMYQLTVSEGSLFIKPATVVTTFTDLQNAVNAASEGVETTIVLGGDIKDMTSYLNIAKDKKIVLDLNNHTLDRGLAEKEAVSEGNVIRVGAGASLTVKNGTITGSNVYGYWDYSGKTPKYIVTYPGALRCTETKVLNVSEVNFVGCKRGALSLNNVENANIERCTFTGNTNDRSNGGAININATNKAETKKTTIKGCLFENNKVTNASGSAICMFGEKVSDVPYADLTIIDSEFTGNIAGEGSGEGGAICAYRIKNLVLEDCTITRNTSLAEGGCGGLTIGGWTDKLTIKGKTIIKNNTCCGKPADLCRTTNEVKIFKVEDLDPASEIGYRAIKPVTEKLEIAKGLKDSDIKCFFTDDPMYQLTVSEGSLFIEPTENHVDIEYKKAGDEKSKHFEKHGVDTVGGINIPEMLPEGAKDAAIIGVKAEGNVEVNVNGKVDDPDSEDGAKGVTASGNAKVTVTGDVKNTLDNAVNAYDQAVVKIGGNVADSSAIDVSGDKATVVVEGTAKGDIYAAGGSVYVGKLEGEIKKGAENVCYLIGFSADGAGLKEFNFSGVSGAPTGVNGKVYNAVSANQITITPKEAGKKIDTSKLQLPAGVTKVEENGALILKFDENFKGGLQDMMITIDGPKPVPAPSSDDSQPLFTGTWGNPVKNGAWKQDANGIWSYTSTETFRNPCGYIANPYAHEGQHQADWFYFDQYGHMLTGWQFINGKWYYLNPTKDGTLGACLIGPGKTPDGYEIDDQGAWTGR